jgi:undecaprenol kinase
MDSKNKKQQNRWKNHNFGESLRHALSGLTTVWKDERNFKFDTVAAVAAIFLGLYLKLAVAEWFWIGWCIISVLTSELWNTVAENIIDLMTHYQRNPLAKKAKDMASAAVLLNAVFALIVGLVIFGTKIWLLIF